MVNQPQALATGSLHALPPVGARSEANPMRRSPAWGGVLVQGAVSVTPDGVLNERNVESQLGRPDQDDVLATRGSSTAPVVGSSMSVCRRSLMNGIGTVPVGHPFMVPLPNSRSLVPGTPGGTKRGPPSRLWFEPRIMQFGKSTMATMPSSGGVVRPRPRPCTHRCHAEQEYGQLLRGLSTTEAEPLDEQSQ